MKKPQRVFSTEEQRRRWPNIEWEWQAHIREHNAITLKNGENPSDYPNNPVAYETLNFGWILSRPGTNGKRHILVQF